MNYVQRAFELMRIELPGNDLLLTWLYTLLAMTKGTETTLENVHDAWSLWQSFSRPEHPAIIPFPELAKETQELDRFYAKAIHNIAVDIQDLVKKNA